MNNETLYYFVLAIICIFVHAIFNSSKIIFADNSPKKSAFMSSCAYMLNVMTLPLVKYDIILSVICVGISSFIGSLLGLKLSLLYIKRRSKIEQIKINNIKS